jgi:hypothetical protein
MEPRLRLALGVALMVSPACSHHVQAAATSAREPPYDKVARRAYEIGRADGDEDAVALLVDVVPRSAERWGCLKARAYLPAGAPASQCGGIEHTPDPRGKHFQEGRVAAVEGVDGNDEYRRMVMEAFELGYAAGMAGRAQDLEQQSVRWIRLGCQRLLEANGMSERMGRVCEKVVEDRNHSD